MECCSAMVVVGGLVAKLCPTLSIMDCSLRGFSVHGISQARISEWVAISFSRGSSNPGAEPRSPAFQAVSRNAGGLLTCGHSRGERVG